MTREGETDYYRLLELGPEATDEEVRKAYRRLALRWHPDRNPGDPEATERFKRLSAAYAVLVDPTKRRAYDQARHAGTPHAYRPRSEDLFRDLFADARASAVFEELARELERMGLRVDRHYFHRTLFGGRTVVTGGVFIITPASLILPAFRLARAAVRGLGSAAGLARPARALPPPRGILDRVKRAGRWLWGLPLASAPPAPAVTDLTLPLAVSRAEAERGGQKRLTLAVAGRPQQLLVSVPAGVRPGTRLRLRGQGRPGPDGAPGDLYLAVEITDE